MSEMRATVNARISEIVSEIANLESERQILQRLIDRSGRGSNGTNGHEHQREPNREPKQATMLRLPSPPPPSAIPETQHLRRAVWTTLASFRDATSDEIRNAMQSDSQKWSMSGIQNALADLARDGHVRRTEERRHRRIVWEANRRG